MLSIVNALVAAVIGLSIALVPRLSRPDVPLGVSVPSNRTGDPVVQRSLRRFEVSMIVATAVAVIVALVVPNESVVMASLLPFALLLVGGVAWMTCRRPIQQAKAQQDWYQGVSVALVAPVTPQKVQTMWWGYLAAAVLLVGTGILGALRWNRLPSPYPTHFGANGHADAYADKSVWTVFGPLIIMAVVIAVVAGLQWLTLRDGARRYADGTSDAGADRAQLLGRLTPWVLNLSAVLIALAVAVISVAIYLGVSPAAMSATTVIVVAVVLLAALASVIVAMRMLSQRPAAAGTGPDAPDDDAHWKGGLIYVNRDDPAAFVPKRTGVGFTVNFGSPAGKGVSIAFVVVILLIVVTSVLAGAG